MAAGLHNRPARPADLPAITELQRRWDTAWFGAPENDENEVGEDLARVPDAQHGTRLLFCDAALVAAAWWWRTECTVVVDPDLDPIPLYAELLPWLEAGGVRAVQALRRDDRLRSALAARGWAHAHSSFELVRDVSVDWLLDEPRWPEGVTVTDLRSDDAGALYHLIYVDADWTVVPGHEARGFDEWRSVFLADAAVPDQQVLVWRDDRLVGAALGRFFSDGTGWIAQLAVACDERRSGLGRALLLEALRRRRAGGASALGLGVQAANDKALQLYLDVGLRIDREWQTFAPAN